VTARHDRLRGVIEEIGSGEKRFIKEIIPQIARISESTSQRGG
jgi:hypothetical protein